MGMCQSMLCFYLAQASLKHHQFENCQQQPSHKQKQPKTKVTFTFAQLSYIYSKKQLYQVVCSNDEKTGTSEAFLHIQYDDMARQLTNYQCIQSFYYVFLQCALLTQSELDLFHSLSLSEEFSHLLPGTKGGGKVTVGM